MLRYVLLALIPSIAAAQPATERRPQVGATVLVGASTADAVMMECCELRTPPSLVRVSHDRAWGGVVGVEGRVYWTPRTSSFVQFERFGERTWRFT